MPATLTEDNPVYTVGCRAQDDFSYCASRLLWIRPKDQPLSTLQLNFPQRYIWEHYLQPAYDRKEPLALIILKARREGVSTLIQAWHFWRATFDRGQSCYLTAHDDDTAQELFRMAKTFYDHLLPKLKPPTERHNRMELEYKAPWGSSIRTRTAKYADIGHGKTIQHWHASEVAYYPEDELNGAPPALPGLLEAVPSTGASSIVFESTAYAADTWFHHLWLEAERLGTHGRVGFGSRRWQACFLPWFIHPDHQAEWFDDMGPLTDEEVTLRGLYTLTLEQIAWRRSKLEELELIYPGNGLRILRQQYPSSSDEPFLLAGTCVFPEACLTDLKKQEFPPALGFSVVKTGQWRHTIVQEKSLSDAALVVWEPPLSGRGFQYTVGVDVSRGVGRDDSAVVVMRMPGYVTVAHWFDNYTGPKQLAYIVGAIARFYGVGSGSLPICTVEINDAGILVNSELETMRGYEPLDIFVWEYWDRIGQQMTTKTGWVTTQGTKDVLLGIANSLLIAKEVKVPSRWIREDMARTIEIKPGQARTTGCDLVIAWLLALMCAYRKIGRHEEEFRGQAWDGKRIFSPTFGGDGDGERREDLLKRDPSLWENVGGVIKAKDPRWALLVKRRNMAEAEALW